MKWLLVCLIACGGSSPKPAPAPPAVDPCARAADGFLVLLPAAKDPNATEGVDKLRALIRDHCHADGWSAQAQRCWGDAKNADDASVCETLLTDDQLAALAKAKDQPPK